jgi:Arc/MetJ-type ribon-helix-helix transcriptional regulator
MALTLTSEQEAIVKRSVREGKFASAKDALNAALSSIDDEALLPEEEKARRAKIRSTSLLQLMQESPLYGLDIEFERDRSPMRELDL